MSESYPTVVHALEQLRYLETDEGFGFQDSNSELHHYSFCMLETATANYAANLARFDLRPGDRIGLIIIEPEGFIISFLAALRLGLVPVPLYPPLSLGGLDSYCQRTIKILCESGTKLLVASDRLHRLLWELVGQVPSLQNLVGPDTLKKPKPRPTFPERRPDDLAFLQYTSGSTSDPKGVMVSHRCLIANAQCITGSHGLNVDRRSDLGVSWLPLYHDMGLIGCMISPLLIPFSMIFIPTLNFLKRPRVWLDTIHEHRGTLTFVPPFALGMVARKSNAEDLAKWDLSCLRVLGCGAEPINANTLREFESLFIEHCSLPKNALLPAYGLAEATLAVTFKPRNEHFRIHSATIPTNSSESTIDQSAKKTSNVSTIEHTSCGVPFPEFGINIIDDQDQILSEGQEGEICIQGPSISPGYFNDPDTTARSFRNGWLHTGDLGYMLDNHLYVTGRLKDLIIINGRNIHPQTLEWVATDVEGVRKGNVVAFSIPGELTEEVVVVFETRHFTESMPTQIKQLIQRNLAISVKHVVALSPGALPKTSSGKLQRRQTRASYLDGQLGKTSLRIQGTEPKLGLVLKHYSRSWWTRIKLWLSSSPRQTSEHP